MDVTLESKFNQAEVEVIAASNDMDRQREIRGSKFCNKLKAIKCLTYNLNSPSDVYAYDDDDDDYYDGDFCDKRIDINDSLGLRLSKAVLLFSEYFICADFFPKRLEVELCDDVDNINNNMDLKRIFTSKVDYYDDDDDCNSKCKFKWLVERLGLSTSLIQTFARPHSLIYLVANIWLIVNLIFEYKYDAIYFQLAQWTTILNEPGFNMTSSIQRHLISLEQKLGEAREMLTSIGAPFLSAHFAIQVIQSSAMLVSFISYFQVILSYNTIAVFNSVMIRLVLDPKREHITMSNLIKNELINYHISSENFLQISFHLKYVSTTGDHGNPKHFAGYYYFDSSGEMNQLMLDNTIMLNHLYEMASNGSLQPLSWSHWFVRRSGDFYGYYLLFWYISCHLFFIFVFTTLDIYIGFDISLAPMDCVVGLMLIIIFSYSIISCVFFLTTTMFNSFEEIIQVRHLLQLFEQIVNVNNVILAGLRTRMANDGGRGKSAGDKVKLTLTQERKQMNYNVLFAFMHFKIFVSQFRRPKDNCGLCVLGVTCIIFIMPTIARLHLPYLDNGGIRALVVGASVISIAMYNQVALPVGYTHARSLRIYKSLNSLLAHMLEVDMVGVEPTGGGGDGQPTDTETETSLYNRHLIWSIRKELDHPDTMKSHFAIKKYGFEFTYSSLVRVHFWLGLLALSFISSQNLSEEIFFSNFLNDPFGLMVTF